MPTGRFTNTTGTPATPMFIQSVIFGTTAESNNTLKPDINVFHWKAQSPAGGGTMNTFLNNFRASVETALLNVKTADYNLVQYIGKYMDDPTSAQSILAAGVPGIITSDRGASFNAGVIRKKSGFTGRNWRGSSHYGALPESFTTKDSLNGTGLSAYTALATVWAGMLTGISDGVDTFFPIILSPSLSNLILNPSVFTGSFVSEFIVNETVGTMKRRKEKAI